MPGKAHRDGAGLHPGTIEHILQPHPRPARIGHRAMPPLRAGDARRDDPARIARTLVDGGDLEMRQRASDRRATATAAFRPCRRPSSRKARRIDFGRERPMPADIVAIIRRQNIAIKHRQRRFEQRRRGALQDHARPCRERRWSAGGCQGHRVGPDQRPVPSPAPTRQQRRGNGGGDHRQGCSHDSPPCHERVMPALSQPGPSGQTATTPNARLISAANHLHHPAIADIHQQQIIAIADPLLVPRRAAGRR